MYHCIEKLNKYDPGQNIMLTAARCKRKNTLNDDKLSFNSYLSIWRAWLPHISSNIPIFPCINTELDVAELCVHQYMQVGSE